MIAKCLCRALMVAALSSIPLTALAEDGPSAGAPLTLIADAGAPAPESPNIHGFAAVSFKTAYVTPRGLVVENQGLVIQPVAGLVLPLGDAGVFKDLAVVSGVWNSINTNQGDTNVGGWNEMDFFVAVNTKVANDFSLSLTYGAWNFPQSTVAKPSTEHNIDLRIGFNDSKCWGDSGFAINPYVDLWWAVSGSSTVVLGKQGDTGYVELGIAPSYTFKQIKDYPITVTVPTYISVGPEGYWGASESGGDPDGNFGVFSTSINATMPLSCIPARYGHWHVDAGLSYFYLINDNLLNAGEILSGNDDRNVFVGSVGIGFGF